MQKVLWSIAILIAFFVVTWFLSLARPLIQTILGDVRARMRELRHSVLVTAVHVVGERFRRFLEARVHEPNAPIVAELEQLTTAIMTVGDHQVTGLQEIETKISRDVEALRLLDTLRAQTTDERQEIIESASDSSVVGLIFLVLLSLVMGFVNMFLLGIFFVEVIGPESIFKYPLPNIPRGYVLAFLMFIIEIASGWAIYRSSLRAQRQDGLRNAGAAFFRFAPWILLAALAIVELAAYSMLSQRVDLPHRLGLDPNGPIYGLAEYFLSFLGLGLTLLLAYLGHAIAEGFDERRRSSIARALVRTARRSKHTAMQQAKELNDLLTRFSESASHLPASVPAEFQVGLGTEKDTNSVLMTVEHVLRAVTSRSQPLEAHAALSSEEQTTAVRLPVRTPSQVWGDLLINLLFLLVLVVAVVFTVLEILSYHSSVIRPSRPALMWLVALATPAAIVGMAIVAWNVLKGLRYASPATAALPERRGRVVLRWVVASALLVADVTLAALAAVAAAPGSSILLFALLGMLQGIALCVFAGWLDRGLLAVAYLGYLTGLGAVLLGAFVFAALAALTAALCFAVIVVVRLFAIPGDLIRGRAAITTQPAQ